METKLKRLIDDSERILITSHISPDPDAVCSLLLTGTALTLNYPAKQIMMALEEGSDGLSSLDGYDQIKIGPLAARIRSFKPDLVIVVDTSTFNRVSRHEPEQVREDIKNTGAQVAIIDHHEPGNDKEECAVYVNSRAPAAAQEVYETLFNVLKLKKPAGYAQTAMLGLYADSGGFAYIGDSYRQTFDMAAQLMADGASIERINNLLRQYSDGDMKVLAELAANATHDGDHTYSFLRDEFVSEWLKNNSAEDLHDGAAIFINDYTRNVGGREWGFVAYRNVLYGPDMYSCSFRAVAGTKDVSLIAQKLNGGGHKGSAGSKFSAKTIEEALELVKQAIAQTAA